MRIQAQRKHRDHEAPQRRQHRPWNSGNTGSTGKGSNTAEDDTIKSPKAGDTSNLVLWVAVLLVSSTAIGAAVVGRKRIQQIIK